MDEIREALRNHARVLEEIIKIQNEHQESILTLGNIILDDEYYTVEEYAAMSSQPIKPLELKMLKSVAFHLSRKHDVAVDGNEFRLDILREAFSWTF
ncbi:hypothetical protein [Desulfosporosinus sp. Sb-LF]|uniref:hypothetical protein n=1 Tax=Desulfosporosinus sp. Sb-LF TaxID=2560027 RepID=UPI00107FC9DD|nr:hypothetical protein [Desulfosporosinus sp. Sb-LF]TGE33349.1 hypothetical protein E4K68_07595 [Desulfosporosinus sp. Sb-LF]